MTDRKLLIGQRLAVGFDGFTIPDEYRRLVHDDKIGNAILFRRNIQSYRQLRSLCADLRALMLAETGYEPFIMIDEECGSVSRLAHVAAPTPCAMAIGATDDPENACRIGRLIGEELRAVGINFNLAPVLDCYSNPYGGAAGNRCFASEPAKAAEFGMAYVRGLQETGVLACGKHFPGHGDTAIDSHLALPVVDKPLDAVRNTELVPFRACIGAGLKGIMSAHVVFPAMEPERVPATVSRRVMTGLLRGELGFGGIILSDGMEMKAVMDLFGIEDGTRRALAAGVDIALVCHSAAQAASVCRCVSEAIDCGAFDLTEAEARYRHIVSKKAELLPPQGGPELFGSEAQRETARRIMRQSVRVLPSPDGAVFPAPDADTLFFGVCSGADTLANDAEPLNAAESCARAFGARYAEPDEAAAADASAAVVFLNRRPDRQAAVDAANRLARRGARVLAVGMNTPVCLDGLDSGIRRVIAWQYDAFSLDIVTDMLRRGI